MTRNILQERHIDADLLQQLAYNEKMAELGKISASVVHELNAPLSVIISASQMIMREQDVPEFVQEMIARINSEAQRLSQLTRGLLSYSSYDQVTAEADLNLTVNFILDFLTFEASRRAVVVMRQLDHRLPLIQTDSNQLKQILLNIVMNALQAMETAGGTLLVETATAGDDQVRVTISDSGPGIPPEVIERIFDRYFTTKKSGVGTGLGLFVTRELVIQLGGAIRVSSGAEGGTTFIVTLPIAP
ncbi:MAG TPA: sensor histidine kinase [Desulfuromonadales bacterium]|nr:sensor histidine kinase [Desulfuromonadales bacterium]